MKLTPLKSPCVFFFFFVCRPGLCLDFKPMVKQVLLLRLLLMQIRSVSREISLDRDSQSQCIYCACILRWPLFSLSVSVLLLEPVGVHLGVWIWSHRSMPRTILLPLAAWLFCWHHFTTSLSLWVLAPAADQLRDTVHKIYSHYREITFGSDN